MTVSWWYIDDALCLLASTVRKSIARPFSVKGSGTHSMHMYDFNCKCDRIHWLKTYISKDRICG